MISVGSSGRIPEALSVSFIPTPALVAGGYFFTKGAAVLSYTLHAKGTTGNSLAKINNTADFTRAALELEVEAVGATPTITFTVKGLPVGMLDIAANYVAVALDQADATVASSSAAIVVTAVGKTRRFIAGLSTRSFDAIAVDASANTNITYSTRLWTK